MAITMNFWDKIANRYSKQPIADEAAYQKKLQLSREYFRPDMEVLEFGCGTGGTALLHAPFVKHISAIDGSTGMIEIARGKQQDSGIKNVEFSVSAIEEYNIADETYDVVLGLSILHLLEDKDAVIKKIYAGLKPGGVFISSTACLTGVMRLFQLILPIGRLFGLLPPVVKFCSEKELEQSLKQNGFKIDHLWIVNKGRVAFIIAKKD